MSLRHIDNLNNTDTIEQSVLLYLENSLEWPSTFISRKKPAETSIRKIDLNSTSILTKCLQMILQMILLIQNLQKLDERVVCQS